MKYIARVCLAAVPTRLCHHFGFAPSPSSRSYVTPMSQPAIHVREFDSKIESEAWGRTILDEGFPLEIDGFVIYFPSHAILYIETGTAQ